MKKLLEKLGLIRKPKFEIRLHDFIYDINSNKWVYVIYYNNVTKHWMLSNGDECDSNGWSPYFCYVNYRSSSKPGVFAKMIKYNDIVRFTHGGRKHIGYYEKFTEFINQHATEIRYFEITKTNML